MLVSTSPAARLSSAAWLLTAATGVLTSPLAAAQAETPTAQAAPAETGDRKQTEEPVTELVVIGTALRNQETISSRRNSDTIIDTLIQDDTGDLADPSLADALARVPGVSTMQVLYGEQESQYVSVRGITPDLNYVSVDGIGMISVANQGSGQRRVDLALIPSQAARRTEVFKTFTPEQEGGAIGGIINIVPHSAFDSKNGKFFVDTSLQYATSNDVPDGNSLGKYKDTPWGGGIKSLLAKQLDDDGKWGLVLTTSLQQRSYDETKRNPNGRAYYTAAGKTTTPDKADWNGFDPAPTAMVSYDFTSFVRQWGGSGMLEFKPRSDWYSSLMAYGYRQTEDQTNNIFTLRAFTGLTNQTQSTGTFAVPDVRTAIAYDHFINDSSGAIFKTIHDFDDQTSLSFRAGYGRTGFYDAENRVTYQAKPSTLSLDYDVSGDEVGFTLNDPSVLMNAASYSLFGDADTLIKAKGDNREFRLDFQRNTGRDSLGFGYKAGIGQRHFEMERDLTATNYTTKNTYKLSDAAYDPQFSPWKFNYPVLWVDYERYLATARPALAVNATTTASDSAASDYRYDETINYGYLSLVYSTDRTRLIGGLRGDSASYGADVPYALGGVYQPQFNRYKGDYRYLLPSLNLVHRLNESVVFKGGYSRTLGRPAPEDLAQAESRNDVNLTISRGNPDLKPRRSDNLDAAAEYYFNGASGMTSLGVFRKTIKDDIYSLSEQEDIDGVSYVVSTPMNATQSKLTGAEFQLINNRLPYLPGVLENKVGFSFNLTRAWGEMDYAMGGEPVHINQLMFQRKWFGNAAVFYKLQNQGEVRLAYNYGDKYYDGIGANPWDNRGPQSRERLDLAVRYRMTDDWIVKFQANNLLNSPVNLGYGENLEMRRAEMKVGRTYFVNFIYNP